MNKAEVAAFCLQNEQLIDDTVREVLTDRAAEAEESGNRMMARRLRRCLMRPRIFNRIVSYTEEAAVPLYLADQDALAGGEFVKWFLDWFANGGWEAVLEFIKALLPLLIGLASFAEEADEAAEDRLFTAYDEQYGDGAIGD
jgi:hypothetical protein